jgi:hypothetical protein
VAKALTRPPKDQCIKTVNIGNPSPRIDADFGTYQPVCGGDVNRRDGDAAKKHSPVPHVATRESIDPKGRDHF